MKKFLFLLAVAAVAVGFSSCNKGSNSILYQGVGSFHPYGNYIVNFDGTKYTLSQNYWPDLDMNITRHFVRFYGELPEGTSPERGPGITIPMTTLYHGSTLLPTSNPKMKDEITYDDPLLGMMKQSDGKPSVGLITNFLVVDPICFLFKKNAENKDDYAKVDIGLEVDENIVPGEKNDTINMRLKFFNNRAEGEKLELVYNYSIDGYQDVVTESFAFDLENLFSPYFDQNKTYIIKLTYKSYEWDQSNPIDEEKVYTKSLTYEWTPGDPYGPYL